MTPPSLPVVGSDWGASVLKCLRKAKSSDSTGGLTLALLLLILIICDSWVAQRQEMLIEGYSVGTTHSP